MKFPLILAAFIALCGAAEMQNSAPHSSGLAQNLGTSDQTGSDSAQNSKPARDLAWLKDVNLTCAKYGIDTSAHPEFRAYARLKDGSALAFASPKLPLAGFLLAEFAPAEAPPLLPLKFSPSKKYANIALGEANASALPSLSLA